MKLAYLEDAHSVFFGLAVNKLITNKTKNFAISLISECSGFIKYSLNKPDEIISINAFIFFFYNWTFWFHKMYLK